MRKLQVLFLLIIVCVSCNSQNNISENYQPQLNDSFEQIHQFKDKSGEQLGTLYVKKLPGKDSIYSELYIMSGDSGLTDTLYSIDGPYFRNKKGIDIHVRPVNHYGYRIIFEKENYIELIALHNEGKNVSDNIHIRWNEIEKIFEVLKTP